MSLTTDPNDPRLGHGTDDKPVPQNEVYLVLSAEERAKGFVRPVRAAYRHVGAPGPKYPLRAMNAEEIEETVGFPYIAFEPYPKGEHGSALGRYWTQGQLNAAGKGCDTVTTMATALAETYAREPGFYGSTYCVNCSRHLPVADFVWDGTTERVGS